MRIEFDTLVAGAGTQIQKISFGTFEGMIEAFDSRGASLGSFSLTGESESTGDNSAIFIGVLTDCNRIKAIELNVDPAGNRGLSLIHI